MRTEFTIALPEGVRVDDNLVHPEGGPMDLAITMDGRRVGVAIEVRICDNEMTIVAELNDDGLATLYAGPEHISLPVEEPVEWCGTLHAHPPHTGCVGVGLPRPRGGWQGRSLSSYSPGVAEAKHRESVGLAAEWQHRPESPTRCEVMSAHFGQDHRCLNRATHTVTQPRTGTEGRVCEDCLGRFATNGWKVKRLK